MSAWTDEFMALMLAEPCATCEAQPGQRCHTKSGRVTLPHAPRHNEAVRKQKEKVR